MYCQLSAVVLHLKTCTFCHFLACHGTEMSPQAAGLYCKKLFDNEALEITNENNANKHTSSFTCL